MGALAWTLAKRCDRLTSALPLNAAKIPAPLRFPKTSRKVSRLGWSLQATQGESLQLAINWRWMREDFFLSHRSGRLSSVHSVKNKFLSVLFDFPACGFCPGKESQ